MKNESKRIKNPNGLNLIQVKVQNLIIFILLLNLFLLKASLFAQDKKSFTIRNYTPQEYNAHVQNWATIQDDRGIVYIANGGGVLEYNGVEWRLIKTVNNSLIRSFAKDKSGRIYAGAVGDFGYLERGINGKTNFVSLTSKLKEEDKNFLDVWFVKIIGRDVYFSTYNTLFRLRDGQIKTWRTSELMQSCFVVNEQVYVYEEFKGIKKVTEDSLALIPFGNFFNDKSFLVEFPYEKNKVLIATKSQGFYIFDFDAIPANKKEQIITKFVTEADSIIKKGRPYYGSQLKDGSFAFGVIPLGVVIINKKGKLLHFFDRKSGLLNGSITNVYEDVENNLWLTQPNGISKITINPSLSYWGDKDGLTDIVFDVTRFNQTMYIGCFNGLFKFSNNQIVRIQGIENPFFCLLNFKVPNNSSKELLLAGTNFNGVVEIRNDKIIPLLPSPKIVFSIVQSRINPSYLFIGKSGSLEVANYKNNTLKPLGRIEGVNIEVKRIVEEMDGTIWVSNNLNQVICLKSSGDILKPKQIIVYTKENGVQGLPIIFSYNDRIVLGTEAGFYRLNKAEDKFIPDSAFGKEFCDGTIRIILFKGENKGNIWIPGIKNNRFGTGLLNKKGMYDWLEAPFYPIPENSFFTVYIEADSSIWINSANGLYRFKGELTKQCSPFLTVIRTAIIGKDSVVYAYGNEQKLKDTSEGQPMIHKLAYKYNSILFNFAALSYYNENLNLYQTYLEGLDNDWSDWGKDLKKEYTNLSEGTYKFHVRSKNMHRVIGEEACYEFTILPPWYRTIWAFIAYFLLSTVIIYTIVYLNGVRLKSANILLEKTVMERTIDLAEVNMQLEEHQAELEIRQEEITAQAELLAATNKELEKLSIVASKTDNAVIIMDPKTNFEWVNEGFVRMFCDLDTLRKERGNSLLLANQKENIQEIVKECLESKKTVYYQTYNPFKLSKLFWTQTTLTPIVDSYGEVIKLIAIDSDISKLKEAELEILRQKDELEIHRTRLEEIVKVRTGELEVAKNKAEESDRLKSSFLANMSHEIRTPMNAIIGFSNLLINEDLQSTDRNEFIKYIINNSNTLLHLIDDIIDLSKIEAGQLKISLRPFYLNKLMLEQLDTFNNKKNSTNNKKVDLLLSIGVDNSEFTIHADALRIQQVLSNLIENALKFTEQGFIEFGYTIESNSIIRFFVKDSGIGMTENQQKLIFNRFTKIEEDKTKLYRGAGLGLSISQNIANLMGGDIFVESEVGKGTTFYFTVPLTKDPERIDTPILVEESKPDYNWSGKTLLIAEDEEGNYQFLEKLLRGSNVKMFRAMNGMEAFNLFMKSKPDLILMDIKMPIMDGMEATKKIRVENKIIPIIALSAYAFNHEIVEIQKEGFNDYLVKPINPTKLLSLLNKYLKE